MHRVSFVGGLCCIAALPFLAGCGSQSSAPADATPTALATPIPNPPHCTPATTDGNGGPYPAASSSDCTGGTTVEVDVIADPKIGGGFSPSNITIRRGTTVRFVWKSDGHNLAPWHTAIEPTGTIVTHTFASAGTYSYQCQVHPGQNGRIVVHA